MPIIMNSQGQGFLVTNAEVPRLLDLRAQIGDEEFDAELERIHARRQLEVTMKEKPVAEPLNFPIIPELGDDGVKRLYKTRYNLLEKQYASLHARNAMNVRQIQQMSTENEALARRLDQQQRENLRLKGLTVDTDRIDKRIRQIAKEANLPLPETRATMTLDGRLEAFFGSILCHLRTEADQDELAD